ncbi:hypothetical protein EON65_04545 [archaeon]|nr:MAG: hypothetical protein EON65_04545 [archaeon]
MSDSRDFANYRNNLSPYDNKVRADKMAREHQIAVEYMEIIRERLADCVRTETVNQFTACKELREKYFSLCADRYHGMLFPPGEEPFNREVPGIKKA